MKSQIDNIKESIFEWKKHNASVDLYQGQIKTLKKQLPDICPICGNVIKKEI